MKKWRSVQHKMTRIDMSLERVVEVMNPLDEFSNGKINERSIRKLGEHGFLIDEEISDAESLEEEDEVVQDGSAFQLKTPMHKQSD